MITYPEARARLEGRPSLPLLVGTPWDAGLSRALATLDPERFFGRPVREPRAAMAVVAGLLLLNDDFDASHGLAQGLEDATGSYWHGLCHRREGHRGSGLASNLANARYWFRRVGAHPAFPAVHTAALRELAAAGAGMRWATETAAALRLRGEWDPFAPIDWIAQAEDGTLSSATVRLIEQIQRAEVLTLLDWCAERALAGE